MPAGIQEAITNNPTAPTLDVTSLGIQLTKIGSNDSPFLSADGKKLVFVGRKRPSHQQGQIYLYDLEGLKERRITYQDGECRDPIIFRDDIIYASTTDELKERPRLFQKSQENSPYPPTELYESGISDINIDRLTHHPGFDGFPWPRPDKSSLLLFSQWNGKGLEVHQLNLKNDGILPLLSKKDRSIESLRPSPDDKQWAWIERLPDSTTQVVVSPSGFATNKQKVLNLPKGDYKDLIWATDKKLMMSAKSLKKFYQLYSFDLEKNCLQSLFDSNSDLSSPQLHSERQAIVFTSTSDGNSQIFYKSLTTSDQCLKWEETKTDKKN